MSFCSTPGWILALLPQRIYYVRLSNLGDILSQNYVLHLRKMLRKIMLCFEQSAIESFCIHIVHHAEQYNRIMKQYNDQ